MPDEHGLLETERVEHRQEIPLVHLHPVRAGQNAAATAPADIERDQLRTVPERPCDRQPGSAAARDPVDRYSDRLPGGLTETEARQAPPPTSTSRRVIATGSNILAEKPSHPNAMPTSAQVAGS